MKRKSVIAILILLLAAGAPAAWAMEQAAQQPTYSKQEYDLYQAARAEKIAQQRVKLLDEFVAKFPQSTLLPYVYRDYYLAYYELKDYPKTIENVDKLLALGEKIDFRTRLEAHGVRAYAFFFGSNLKPLQTPEMLASTRAACAEGLQMLDKWAKPEDMTQEQLDQQKKGLSTLFHSISGIAANIAKDYKGAAEGFRAALALDPKDALNNYRLGVALLQQDPPQYLDGFWAVARAVALKVPDEARVKNYLRVQMNRYQAPTCDSLLDAQVNELLSLAANSTERPADYSIPSREELNKLLAEHGDVDAIVTGLKDGSGAKVVWLAACGAEFPELLGKVFEKTEVGDAVSLKVYTAGKQEEVEAATAPNMEVRIEGQPEAKRLKKDDVIVYSAALKSFTPDPFMVQLEKGKVRADTLPPEEKAPAKAAKKAPAKKPPAKKPPAKTGR